MSLVTIASQLVDNLGYVGLAVGLVINTVGIPIPSELILGLAGIAVKTGRFSLGAVLVLAVIFQMVGLLISYVIARYGGVALIERYGKYLLIRQREIASAERAFNRYGGRLVLFGLCLPALHGYVGYPAGLAKMDVRRFSLFAAIGSLAWALILTGLGYYLGGHLDTIDSILHRFGIIMVVLLLVAAVWWIKRQRSLRDTTPNHPA